MFLKTKTLKVCLGEENIFVFSVGALKMYFLNNKRKGFHYFLYYLENIKRHLVLFMFFKVVLHVLPFLTCDFSTSTVKNVSDRTKEKGKKQSESTL